MDDGGRFRAETKGIVQAALHGEYPRREAAEK